MATKTLDKALPGTQVTVNDKGLAISPEVAGKKLTIMGTTTNDVLTLREPTRIRDAKRIATALDHGDGRPSELSLAVEAALRAGAENIEVIKIADASGEDIDNYSPEDRFDALEEAYDVLKVVPVDVVVPVGAKFDVLPTGVNSNGTTRKAFWKQLGDFCYQSTKEANSVIGVIATRTPSEHAYNQSLSGAPTGEAGWLFDTPAIAHITDWSNYLQALGGYSAEHFTDYLAGSNETSPGVLDSNYDGWARDTGGTIAVDEKGNNVDGGARISVVAVAARIRHDRVRTLGNKLGLSAQTDMNTDGAVEYGAILTRLPAEVGATNKTIPGVFAARQLSASMAKNLMNFRYVTMVDRNLGYVVVKDVTGAHYASNETKSDFVLTQVVRIVDEAIDIVREAGEEFISKPLNAANIGAMDNALRESLKGMQRAGALKRFDLGILADADAQALGELNIDLTLVPAVELIQINTTLSLAKE